MSATLALGDLLANRYRLTSILGEGGMGAVYEAIQVDLNRPVAVKLMLPHAGMNVDSVARFQREARVTAALHHPGAVKIFDFGRDTDGRFYIVMEKLLGTVLRSFVMPDGPLLPLARSVSIAMQIADVLLAAHAIGLVHRDLKPENVFLEVNQDGTDRVVVVDFGLAYIEDRADASRMTKEGVIAGTPIYMSPEQCAGKNIGTPADVYALGCMLYEMACGFVPFEGASFQLLVKHSFEDPVPPSQRRSDVYVPRALEELIMEMLRKAPETRPTADVLVARLGKIALTLGERERGRGRELLEGRVARMIPTVRPASGPFDPGNEGGSGEMAMRPTALPEAIDPSVKTLAVVGALDVHTVLGLRANGIPPVEVHGPPMPANAGAIFAPGASDDLVRTLVGFGLPVLTDGDPDDLDHATRMLALGVADVISRPVRVEQLATKIQRAMKKHARRR
jgi:serine/threonine-protein kinase